MLFWSLNNRQTIYTYDFTLIVPMYCTAPLGWVSFLVVIWKLSAPSVSSRTNSTTPFIPLSSSVAVTEEYMRHTHYEKLEESGYENHYATYFSIFFLDSQLGLMNKSYLKEAGELRYNPTCNNISANSNIFRVWLVALVIGDSKWRAVVILIFDRNNNLNRHEKKESR